MFKAEPQECTTIAFFFFLFKFFFILELIVALYFRCLVFCEPALTLICPREYRNFSHNLQTHKNFILGVGRHPSWGTQSSWSYLKTLLTSPQLTASWVPWGFPPPLGLVPLSWFPGLCLLRYPHFVCWTPAPGTLWAVESNTFENLTLWKYLCNICTFQFTTEKDPSRRSLHFVLTVAPHNLPISFCPLKRGKTTPQIPSLACEESCLCQRLREQPKAAQTLGTHSGC